MNKYLEIFLSAFLAGIMIGIGVSVYLFVLPVNKVVATLLFGFGLFTIIQFQMFLYTGKVGFILDNKPKYFLDLAIGLVGNFLGIIIFCSLFKLTRFSETLVSEAKVLVEAKQNDSWYSILILSIFCGILIYLAVVGHKKTEYGLGKALMCFLGVSIFILCGFEHCIANAGYYTYAGVFDFKVVGYFLLMIIGNGIGSVFFDGLLKLVLHFKEKKVEDNKIV